MALARRSSALASLCVVVILARTTHAHLGLLKGLGGWRSANPPAAATAVSTAACPPANFDSIPDFNLVAWASAPWYVQKQLPLSYQPRNQLNCVRAQYNLLDPNNPTAGVQVRNYANRDKVNGPSMGTSGSGSEMYSLQLIAVPDPSATGSTAASKLLVGPRRLKETLPYPGWTRAFGPYWVVAAGVSANTTLGYDWAIVSGGPPVVQEGTGCRPGQPGDTEGQYFGGLWLFSRKPVDPVGTEQALAVAQQLGLSTQNLLDVQQQGCTYLGA